MSAFPYRVTDEAAFLERQARMHAALRGPDLSAARLSAILAEVGPLPWVLGRWYRITVLAGDPQVRHMHGIDEAGREHALDLPYGTNHRRMELEVSPLGRQAAIAGMRHVPAMTFLMRDGRAAVLHEIDLLAVEEIAA